MRNKLDQEEVAYISFEDFNTRGLKGTKNGQSDSTEDTWAIYAYNKGVHTEEADEAVETSRGGSHGVGEIASNAASDLNLMYFANFILDVELHENVRNYRFVIKYELDSVFITRLLDRGEAQLIFVIQSRDNKFFQLHPTQLSIEILKSRISVSQTNNDSITNSS
jgi:hypothetical protein